MIQSKQDIISEFELKPVLKLDDIIIQRKQEEYLTRRNTFIVDLKFGTQYDMALYPVTIEAKIGKTADKTGKALFLHGTEVRYLADIRNTVYLPQDDISFLNINFREEELSANKPRLWLFVPHTRGWQYYEDVLVPNEYATCDKDLPEDFSSLPPQANPLQK
jgi:hypothetical protein